MEKIRIAHPETAVITAPPMQNLFDWALLFEENHVTLKEKKLPCELKQTMLLHHHFDKDNELDFFIEYTGEFNGKPVYKFVQCLFTDTYIFTDESAEFYLN